MFNSKYSKILTAILVVVIIAIIAIIAYFVHDIYFVKAKNKDLKDQTESFGTSIRKNEKDNTVEGNYTNPVDTMTSLDREDQVSDGKQYMEGYEIKGTISIPKTGLECPVLEKVTKKSLETSVAILYGVGLNQPGNTVIVGHNYRNGLFFSDNKKLANGDIVKITDQEGTTVTYSIYDMFETTPSDADYMARDTEGAKEISLSTCTDDSSARLVILAKEQ